jgi:hypothetical protein
MVAVRCKVCGKIYSDKPKVCEYDGLNDFEETSDKTESFYLRISSETTSLDLPLEDLPFDISKAGIPGKISFPFTPSGVTFPVRLPINVIFKENDLIVKKAEKVDALNLSIRKETLKTKLKLKRKGDINYQIIGVDSGTEDDYYEIELSLDDEILINGLLFKYIKK